MKLMFTLRGSDNQDTDLVATVDGRTTVGDLAEHLVLADPERQRSGVCLLYTSPSPRDS